MTCKRCRKRITERVSIQNGGYCEICLMTIARGIVTQEEFDNGEDDTLWRETATESLTNLYNALKNAGMENPLEGMHSSTRSLFRSLNIKIT